MKVLQKSYLKQSWKWRLSKFLPLRYKARNTYLKDFKWIATYRFMGVIVTVVTFSSLLYTYFELQWMWQLSKFVPLSNKTNKIVYRLEMGKKSTDLRLIRSWVLVWRDVWLFALNLFWTVINGDDCQNLFY